MGLEIATYINGLNEEWPTPEDFRREGDDHLRLLKGSLLRTFPNVAGEVTLSHNQLNALLQYVQNVEGNLIGATAVFPVGGIIMWSGSIGTIPAGWGLCDGQGGRPDLRGRFIIGAGGSYNVTANGGAESQQVTIGSHSHTLDVQSTTLTLSQLPSHSHGAHVGFFGRLNLNNASFPTGLVIPGVTGYFDEDQSVTDVPNAVAGNATQAVGGDGGHTHSATAASANLGQQSVDILPPYFALAFIIKVADTPVTPVPPPVT